MAGLGATAVLFGGARYFARGSPPTMTREYQEATDEYLKVSFRRPTLYFMGSRSCERVTNAPLLIGIQGRTHHWYL